MSTTAGEVAVTISIGGATATAPGTAVDVVLRAADGQLYGATEAGRDRSAGRALDGDPRPVSPAGDRVRAGGRAR